MEYVTSLFRLGVGLWLSTRLSACMGPSSLAAVGLLVAMSVGMSAEGRESNTSLQHTFISVSGWPQSGTRCSDCLDYVHSY